MIFLNGKFVPISEAKIEHNDRGLLLSDGLFETMRVYKGHVFALKEHLERLMNGTKRLKISIQLSLDEWDTIISELLNKNNLKGKNASLRLTITRGVGPRGLLPPENPNLTVMLVAFPLIAHTYNPAKVFISSIPRNERSPLSNIKSLNYLDNILARQEAVDNGFDEAILFNTKDVLAEASAANVFIVTNEGEIATPRLEDGALPGVTRGIVIQLSKECKIPISERRISAVEFSSAREVFLTNSLVEIQPISRINNTLVNDEKVGEITLKLQRAYADKINMLLMPRKVCSDILHSLIFKVVDRSTDTMTDSMEKKIELR